MSSILSSIQNTLYTLHKTQKKMGPVFIADVVSISGLRNPVYGVKIDTLYKTNPFYLKHLKEIGDINSQEDPSSLREAPGLQKNLMFLIYTTTHSQCLPQWPLWNSLGNYNSNCQTSSLGFLPIKGKEEGPFSGLCWHLRKHSYEQRPGINHWQSGCSIIFYSNQQMKASVVLWLYFQKSIWETQI